MTILNERSVPVVFDPVRHVDTQILNVGTRTSKQFVWGIRMEPGDTVALARLRSNLDEAEWVQCKRLSTST